MNIKSFTIEISQIKKLKDYWDIIQKPKRVENRLRRVKKFKGGGGAKIFKISIIFYLFVKSGQAISGGTFFTTSLF